MKRYCGMRMTPESLAFLGMISAHEYIEMTNVLLEQEWSAEARRQRSEDMKREHERRRARRAQIV